MSDSTDKLNLANIPMQSEIPENVLENIDREVYNFFKNNVNFQDQTRPNYHTQLYIMMATPERWVQFKRDKILRDEQKNIIKIPLIIIKRGNIEPATEFNGLSFQKAYPQLWMNVNKIITTEQGTNNISKLAITHPFPNYIKITYDISVQTKFVTDINNIIEQIISNGFGGFFYNENNYLLKWEITSISDASNFDDFTNDPRVVTHNFQFVVTGAIVTTINKDKIIAKPVRTLKKVIFTESVKNS